MRLCLTSVVFLSGLAACSHQPDNAAKYAEPPQTARDEAGMQPASLEPTRAAEPVGQTPAVTPRADTTNEPGAPMVADTKGTASGDFNNSNNTSSPPKMDAPEANRPAGTPPDNTRVNERDRSPQAQTPLDQGNGARDLEITQQIRKSVVGDKSLSFTAKNVKIITNGGKVTLRGPVKTAEERAAIEAFASKIAGPNNVDNQLEIKK